MEIITNAKNRKSLVKALSEHFGERAVTLDHQVLHIRLEVLR